MGRRIYFTDYELAQVLEACEDYSFLCDFDENDEFRPSVDARRLREKLLSKLRGVEWQDESRTEVRVEHVYKTRYDCKPGRREAAL